VIKNKFSVFCICLRSHHRTYSYWSDYYKNLNQKLGPGLDTLIQDTVKNNKMKILRFWRNFVNFDCCFQFWDFQNKNENLEIFKKKMKILRYPINFVNFDFWFQFWDFQDFFSIFGDILGYAILLSPVPLPKFKIAVLPFPIFQIYVLFLFSINCLLKRIYKTKLCTNKLTSCSETGFFLKSLKIWKLPVKFSTRFSKPSPAA